MFSKVKEAMVKMQDRIGNQTTTRKKKQHGNTNNVTVEYLKNTILWKMGLLDL